MICSIDGGNLIFFLDQIVQIQWTHYGIAVIIALFFGTVFRRAIVGVLSGYLFLIVVVTIIIRPVGESAKFEAIPLWSYLAFLRDPGNSVLKQIVANIVLFIPVGIMLQILCGNLKKAIMLGLLVSVAIELTQLLSYRGLCEVDDVIHNTAGVFAGFMFSKSLGVSTSMDGLTKKGKESSK